MLHLAGFNILFVYLRLRLTDVSSAEWSLIIREFNQYELCLILSPYRSALDVDDGLLEFIPARRTRRLLDALDESLDLLKVLLEPGLPLFERLDLFFQVLILLGRLCDYGLNAEK